MPKKHVDYFELIKKQYAICVRAADDLHTVSATFVKGEKCAKRDELIDAERSSLALSNEISEGLLREFITPIDQDDILRLSQSAHELTVCAARAANAIFACRRGRPTDGVVALASSSAHHAQALYDAVCEIENFKKPARLWEKLSDLRKCASDSNADFPTALAASFRAETDAENLIAEAIVCAEVENCRRACLRAAQALELIVLKNT